MKKIVCLPRVRSHKGGMKYKKQLNAKYERKRNVKSNMRRVQSSKLMKMNYLKNFYV
jgi:hypothetical protein